MQFDKIQNNDVFFIFGAGLLGRHICDRLVGAGFTVLGFFDNSEFSVPFYRNIEIIPFDKAQTLASAYKNAIVIVSLINPFDHIEIKDALLNKGFSRIICKRNILKYETKYKINTLYDIIVSFQENIDLQNIIGAEFERWGDENGKLQDNGFINYNNDNITAYVPIELIYAVGKPVIMQQQVVSMFEYFQGYSTGDVELFWKYACKTQADLPKKEIEKEKKRILGGRLQIYRYMTQALAMDSQFFVRHPVTVRKKDGVFLIQDGMHRALFLYSHGFRYIPCSMPAKHYREWISKGKSFSDDKKILITPVLHPFYYLKHSVTENMYKTRLDAIFQFLAEQNIYEGTVLDMGHNDGWIGRNLHRAGFSVMSLVNEEERRHIAEINAIEDTDIEIVNTVSSDKQFDIIINIDLQNFKEVDTDFIKYICVHAEKFIFFETENIDRLESLQREYKVLKCSAEVQCTFSKRYLVAVQSKG